MNQQIYDIQIRSIRTAIEHLHLMDLDELQACAEHHGTAAERKMLIAIRHCLATLLSDC
jgi:hypothetical protein